MICGDVAGKLFRSDTYRKIPWREDWFILENLVQFSCSQNVVIHSDWKERRLRRLQPGASQEVSQAQDILWSAGNLE